MKLLSVFIVLVVSLMPSAVFSQLNMADSILHSRGELIIQFSKHDLPESFNLGSLLSIDRVETDSIIAYTNRKQFEEFIKYNIPFGVIVKKYNEEDYPPGSYSQVTASWDMYPTYHAYDSIMHSFQNSHPSLCRIDTFGYSTTGRLLLAAVLKGNSGGRPVPQFLYTSTMHGDETIAYVLMLRLIDYLLSNYGNNPEITALLDSTEIWINPLANPDGTYKGGDYTITGAIRGNHNFIDLNRNFPDPKDGNNPDQNQWQSETIAFMALADKQNFVMSANFHGGAEVVNYPWDTWSRLPADNQWWLLVSHEYADTAQFYSPPGYFDDFGSGVINGYQWYSISGGRQDYMNYFAQCRESTIEISASKMPPAIQLPIYWNYNYRSLINYIKQLHYGVAGVVKDSLSGKPIKAKVSITSHDLDSSHVYSRSSDGYYTRLVYDGQHNITFSASGYLSKTFNVNIQNYSKTVLNVELMPDNTGLRNAFENTFSIYPVPVQDFLTVVIPEGIAVEYIGVFSIEGRLVKKLENVNCNNHSLSLSVNELSPGLYLIQIKSHAGIFMMKFIKE